MLHHGDAFDIIKTIPDASVDLFLQDLPYGSTNAFWDSPVHLDNLWRELKRAGKPNCTYLFHTAHPFTTDVIMSNRQWFKFEWIWLKGQAGSFANAKYQPLRITESILAFSAGRCRYYPIMRKGRMRKRGGKNAAEQLFHGLKNQYVSYSDEYYPTVILDFPNSSKKGENIHPTQKPVDLLEYLIRSDTEEGDLVVDLFAGSGSTGIAAINTSRRYILAEKELTYYTKMVQRIEQHGSTR